MSRIKSITARLQEAQNLQADTVPQWQKDLLKSLSYARRPKIEVQTEMKLRVAVNGASIFPQMAKIMAREELDVEIEPESSSLVRITFKKLST